MNKNLHFVVDMLEEAVSKQITEMRKHALTEAFGNFPKIISKPADAPSGVPAVLGVAPGDELETDPTCSYWFDPSGSVWCRNADGEHSIYAPTQKGEVVCFNDEGKICSKPQLVESVKKKTARNKKAGCSLTAAQIRAWHASERDK